MPSYQILETDRWRLYIYNSKTVKKECGPQNVRVNEDVKSKVAAK